MMKLNKQQEDIRWKASNASNASINGYQELMKFKNAPNVAVTNGTKRPRRMKKLPKYSWTTFEYGKDQLQGKRGLYVYWLDDRCLYVGAAHDLYKRAFRIFRNPDSWGFNKLLKAIVNVVGTDRIKVEAFPVSRGSIERWEMILELKLKPFCHEFHHPYRPCLAIKKGKI